MMKVTMKRYDTITSFMPGNVTQRITSCTKSCQEEGSD